MLMQHPLQRRHCATRRIQETHALHSVHIRASSRCLTRISDARWASFDRQICRVSHAAAPGRLTGDLPRQRRRTAPLFEHWLCRGRSSSGGEPGSGLQPGQAAHGRDSSLSSASSLLPPASARAALAWSSSNPISFASRMYAAYAAPASPLSRALVGGEGNFSRSFVGSVAGGSASPCACEAGVLVASTAGDSVPSQGSFAGSSSSSKAASFGSKSSPGASA
mmetsp:Transcript_45070/g.130425  ORF Transcript_45070/g.130425 Transcript_45070/m.130425 type:complete len:222 (-) Transcript_45070:1075-1740(-)